MGDQSSDHAVYCQFKVRVLGHTTSGTNPNRPTSIWGNRTTLTVADIGSSQRLGPPEETLVPFFEGGFPCENRLQKKVGTLFLTSLLEDLGVALAKSGC